MRRAMLVMLFALFGAAAALTLGSSVAGASTGDPVGLDQSQSLLNRNGTSQQSDAEADSKQINVNLPIAVLSPGANQGDVNQSNEADTTAESTNENTTDQSISDTSQEAEVEGGNGWSEHGANQGGGDITQDQDVSNANETSQDSTATATTEQTNVNLPIAVLSPGANQGDVNQSNEADTTAESTNENTTDQSIHGTSQEAAVENGSNDGPKPGGGDITQDQDVSNANETDQDSTATATTEQTNVNLPVTILGHRADDRAGKRDGKHDGKGWNPCEEKGGHHDRPSHHGPSHSVAPEGDVNQSNEADTTAESTNENTTDQSISDTSQKAEVDGGKGWSKAHRPKYERPKYEGPKHDGPEYDGPMHGGGDITQYQDVSNANETDQDSTATATTEQDNVNRPVSTFGHRADDRGGKDDGKHEPEHDGKGWKGCDRCNQHRPSRHPAPLGDVNQTNDADTTATSSNRNATDQSIAGTSQKARLDGGKGRPQHGGGHRPDRCGV